MTELLRDEQPVQLTGDELVDWAVNASPDQAGLLTAVQKRYIEVRGRRVMNLQWPADFFKGSIELTAANPSVD